MNQKKSYRLVANEILFEHEHKNKIHKTFFAVSDYYKNNPNPGACHLISSILHVLLKEQGIENDLCIGEVTYNNGVFFDHSWIEINEKVFDIAIQLTLQNDTNPPVYAGYDLGTGQLVESIYGITTPSGLDSDAQIVLKTPFVKYLNEYPRHKTGAWHVVKLISKELRLMYNLPDLTNRYASTQRKLISERKYS